MDRNVYDWAVQLTRRYKVCSHKNPLRPESFINLTRDKNLQPALSFLIRHVRPSEERRLIRLNLKHSRLRKRLTDEEGEMTPAEERLKMKTAIVDTGSEISSEVQEIQQMSQNTEMLRHRDIELQRRIVLLKVVRNERQKEIQKCNLWASQLSLLQEDLPNAKDDQSTVDINLQKHLRENLQDLENIRRLIVMGHLSTPDRIHEKKLNVWEHVGHTLLTWGPRSLMAGMICDVREATRNLNSLSKNIDLLKDAQILRLKCEADGTFIDEMNPDGVIESVRELLGQMSASHVRLYVEANQADRAALSLTRALGTLNKNIRSAAQRTYTDEPLAEAVIEVVKENINIAGERAALNAAQELTSALQERADAAALARDALRVKYAQIISFNKEVQEGVEKVQCLAVCVNDGWQVIKKRLEEVRSEIEAKLECVTYPTPVSEDSLGVESEKFAAVSLSRLLSTKTEEPASDKLDTFKRYKLQMKADMSTSPLEWYDHSGAQSGWSSIHQLCNGMLSWDGVFDAICKKQTLTTCLHNQMEQMTFSKKSLQHYEKSDILSMQNMKEITEKVEASDSKLEKDMIRLTRICENQLAESMQHIVIVKKQLAEWWEQPAKGITLYG